MENLIELNEEEKININGGFFLGPLVFNITGFVHDVINGFSSGLTDSIKK